MDEQRFLHSAEHDDERRGGRGRPECSNKTPSRGFVLIPPPEPANSRWPSTRAQPGRPEGSPPCTPTT
jgi:hypothetical protein